MFLSYVLVVLVIYYRGKGNSYELKSASSAGRYASRLSYPDSNPCASLIRPISSSSGALAKTQESILLVCHTTRSSIRSIVESSESTLIGTFGINMHVSSLPDSSLSFQAVEVCSAVPSVDDGIRTGDPW